MSELSRTLLSQPVDLRRIDVTHLLPPPWRKALAGKKLFVQELDAGNRAQHLKQQNEERGTRYEKTDSLDLLMKCLCDDRGDRVFEHGERAALGKALGAECQALLEGVANKINGFFLTRDDVEKVCGGVPSTNGSSVSVPA